MCYHYYDMIITLKAPNSINPPTTLPRQQRGLYTAYLIQVISRKSTTNIKPTFKKN